MQSIAEISEILDQMLKKVPRERDYNTVFEKISNILKERNSYSARALDLRFRFTLFMQEEFDAIPKEEWKLDDPSWLAGMEQKAKEKLLEWIRKEIS